MRRFAVVVIVALAACGGTTPSVSPATPRSVAPPAGATPVIPSPSAAATASPRATVTPIASSAVPPTDVPTATVSPTLLASPAPTLDWANPPTAVMSLRGSGVEVEGKLGTYTIGQFASDGPWLPARTLGHVTVTRGSRSVVRFSGGIAVAGWDARYAASSDEDATVTRGISDGELVDGRLELAAPPDGDWVVALGLDYPADQGTGSYFWHVTVMP